MFCVLVCDFFEEQKSCECVCVCVDHRAEFQHPGSLIVSVPVLNVASDFIAPALEKEGGGGNDCGRLSVAS